MSARGSSSPRRIKYAKPDKRPKARAARRSERDWKDLERVWAGKGNRGLPPIAIRDKQTQAGRQLRQLTREEAYVRRKTPLEEDAVNPITKRNVEQLAKATAAALSAAKDPNDAAYLRDAPSPDQFGLPSDWSLERVTRQVLAKDNYYVGPCRKKQGGKLRPNLRSLKEVYECLYTDKKRGTPFCRGNKDFPPSACAPTKAARAARAAARPRAREAELQVPLVLELPEVANILTDAMRYVADLGNAARENPQNPDLQQLAARTQVLFENFDNDAGYDFGLDLNPALDLLGAVVAGSPPSEADADALVDLYMDPGFMAGPPW